MVDRTGLAEERVWTPPTDDGARRSFAERMHAWGENSPDSDWFAGDCLNMVLSDCGRASQIISLMLDEIAALRQSHSPDRDAGEGMREACAKVCESRAASSEKRGGELQNGDHHAEAAGAYEAAGALYDAAAAIRALPLSQEGKPSC